MTINYVSISGVRDSRELSEIALIKNLKDLDFPIAIGYQVSHKSLTDQTVNPRQPRFDEINYLCSHFSNIITAMHYYTKDSQTILGDLEIIAKETNSQEKQTLLQFNTLPPTREVLEKAKDLGFETILKVAVVDKSSGGYKVWQGEAVEDVSSGDVSKLVDQIRQRKDLISYAMFDPSHGTNLGLDLSEESIAIKFGRAIREDKTLDNVGLVFAGGIGPENVREVLTNLRNYFPRGVSVDTESAVRTKNVLDLTKTERYLIEAKEGLE